jgi:hypothetical protein
LEENNREERRKGENCVAFRCLTGSSFSNRWYQQLWYIIKILVPVRYSFTRFDVEIRVKWTDFGWLVSYIHIPHSVLISHSQKPLHRSQ